MTSFRATPGITASATNYDFTPKLLSFDDADDHFDHLSHESSKTDTTTSNSAAAAIANANSSSSYSTPNSLVATSQRQRLAKSSKSLLTAFNSHTEQQKASGSAAGAGAGAGTGGGGGGGAGAARSADALPYRAFSVSAHQAELYRLARTLPRPQAPNFHPSVLAGVAAAPYSASKVSGAANPNIGAAAANKLTATAVAATPRKPAPTPRHVTAAMHKGAGSPALAAAAAVHQATVAHQLPTSPAGGVKNKRLDTAFAREEEQMNKKQSDSLTPTALALAGAGFAVSGSVLAAPYSPKKLRVGSKDNSGAVPVPVALADEWYFPSTPKKPASAAAAAAAAGTASPVHSSQHSESGAKTAGAAGAAVTPPSSPPPSGVKQTSVGMTHVAGHIYQTPLGNRVLPVKMIGEGVYHQVFSVEATGTVVEDGVEYDVSRIALKAEKTDVGNTGKMLTYTAKAIQAINNPALGCAQLTALKFPVGKIYRYATPNKLGIAELMVRKVVSADGWTVDAWANGERYEDITGKEKELLDLMIYWLTETAKTYCPLLPLKDPVALAAHHQARRAHFEKLPYFALLKDFPGFSKKFEEEYEGLELCNDLYSRNFMLDSAGKWKFIDASPLQHDDFYLHLFSHTCAVANGSTGGNGFNHARFNRNIWNKAVAGFPADLKERLEKSLVEKQTAVDNKPPVSTTDEEVIAMILAQQQAAIEAQRKREAANQG